MKVSIEDLSAVKKKVVVEIPPENVQKEVESAYKNLQKTASIPGFRKGKIPRDILEKYYGDHVKDDVTSKLIDDSYPSIIKEHKISVTSRPEISDISNIQASESFKYTAVVEVKPEIKVEGYKDIKIKKEEASATDKEIDDAMNLLKERHATFKDIEGDAAAKEGNLAVIDFTGSIDGNPIKNGMASNYSLVIGSGALLKEFEEGILGMKKDEERDINVNFPEDYANKELAGKLAAFRITLKGLKEKVLPDLNDDFAKDVDCETVEQLREKMKEDLKRHKESSENERARDEIIKELINRNTFEVPKSLVEHYNNYLIGHAVERFKKGMIDSGEVGLSAAQLKEKYAKMAEELVRRDIIIDAISRSENLTVLDSEIDSKVKEIAERRKESFSSMRERMEKEGEITYIKESLLEEKVFNLILSGTK
ncbi:MAG: trigger factor [Deltaproteobacteria bacterium GWC2_42_11]|nr:MAG: trigger factor [Deltaproteobacteria bacterium GWC2_42_11]HBO84682.1 trigger factor [Deltaproteobacteria bacterium]